MRVCVSQGGLECYFPSFSVLDLVELGEEIFSMAEHHHHHHSSVCRTMLMHQ